MVTYKKMWWWFFVFSFGAGWNFSGNNICCAKSYFHCKVSSSGFFWKSCQCKHNPGICWHLVFLFYLTFHERHTMIKLLPKSVYYINPVIWQYLPNPKCSTAVTWVKSSDSTSSAYFSLSKVLYNPHPQCGNSVVSCSLRLRLRCSILPSSLNNLWILPILPFLLTLFVCFIACINVMT